MTTTKRILEGDTSRFAFAVAFQKDPDDGAGATREEALSWGGVEIWVEGRNLCAHLEGDTIVLPAHWYLLPLLEWLSACWDYLLHEERLPLRIAGDDSWRSLQETAKSPPALDETDEALWDIEWQNWWLRHSLLSCRQGGLFPDVLFRRWRDRIEISWGQRPLAGQPDNFRFLIGEGFARLPVADVANPIYAVLHQAADYLVSQAPDSERFRKLREGLASLKGKRTSKRVALLAGLGITPEEQKKRWAEVTAPLATRPTVAAAGLVQTELFVAGSCQAALMFGSVAPTIGAADAMALAGKLIDLYSPESELPELRKLVREEPIDAASKRPWTQGYNLAEEILDDLSLPGGADEWVDVREICAQFGISVDDLPLNDRGIRAVSIAGPEHRPATLLNPNHATYLGVAGRRFSLAHELCHLLFDRVYGARLAMASGPWAPRDLEARANAFAAMFLMPTELIRRLRPSLSQPVNSVVGVQEMASRLHTSFKATLEHLKNLNFLSEEEHDRIDIEAEGNQPVRVPLEMERQFRELAERWRRETGPFSSVSKKMTHPAYRTIIEMGKQVVPWILGELRDRPGLWFEALKEITGQTPVPARAQSDPRQAREAWLKWGQEQGLIEETGRPDD